MDITPILANTQATDQATRSAAEQQLLTFQNTDPIGLMQLLAAELAAEDKPATTRQLAGLLLKNVVCARSDGTEAEAKRQLWIQGNAAQKDTIRANVLTAVGSPIADVRQASAQAIGLLASIDLPTRAWDGLIDVLVGHVQTGQNNHLRQGALLALGFTCEEITADDLESSVKDKILTAVAHGARPEEMDKDIRLAALSSLHNALQFAASNFKNENERKYVLHLVMTAAKCTTDVRVQLEAFECLVEIAATYYEAIADQMNELFQLTSAAIQGSDDGLRMQGFEFWSTICEVEMDLGGDEENMHYADQAAQHIVPLILACLPKGPEVSPEYLDDDEDWNSVSAARVALKLMAAAVGDPILNLTVPFIQSNIGSEDWHHREAALQAVGLVLEGPSCSTSGPLASMAMAPLMGAGRDPNPHIRHSAMDSLDSIMACCHVPDDSINPSNQPIVRPENVEQVAGLFVEGLKDTSPSVAEKAASAIENMTTGSGQWAQHAHLRAEEAGATGDALDEAYTAAYVLQPNVMAVLIQELLTAAERMDALETQLQRSCYDALNEVVLNYPPCSSGPPTSLLELMQVVFQKLEQVAGALPGDPTRQLQGLLCGTIMVIVQKVGSTDDGKQVIVQSSKAVLELLFKILNGQRSAPHVEALLALSALINCLELEFVKHMETFLPYILNAITYIQDTDAVAVGAGRIQDLCNTLGDKLIPFLEPIAQCLITTVSKCDASLSHSAIASILGACGDLCLAVEAAFTPYLPHVLPLLKLAADYSVSGECIQNVFSEDRVILINGVLEAYASMLQGSKDHEAMQAIILPFTPDMYKFFQSVYNDEDRDDDNSWNLVGCVGDLADIFGTKIAQLFHAPEGDRIAWYWVLLTECAQEAEDESVLNTVNFAQEAIKRATTG